ncbi:hypothetical protein ACIO8F_41130 [Streptomyces sp. NPDC087228]|uniref:hypothetical protein n=1 Tax=Streptomyces sp. NPDC087228 TaxID=3365772 RepID=UPI00380B0F6A
MRGRERSGRGAFGAGDGEEPGGGSCLLGEDCFAGLIEQALDFLLGAFGAGEAVAVGAFYLTFGHPGGVVLVPVGDDGSLLFLVLLRGAVDVVRGHRAGGDVDDQDTRGAVG